MLICVGNKWGREAGLEWESCASNGGLQERIGSIQQQIGSRKQGCKQG